MCLISCSNVSLIAVVANLFYILRGRQGVDSGVHPRIVIKRRVVAHVPQDVIKLRKGRAIVRIKLKAWDEHLLPNLVRAQSRFGHNLAAHNSGHDCKVVPINVRARTVVKHFGQRNPERPDVGFGVELLGLHRLGRCPTHRELASCRPVVLLFVAFCPIVAGGYRTTQSEISHAANVRRGHQDVACSQISVNEMARDQVRHSLCNVVRHDKPVFDAELLVFWPFRAFLDKRKHRAMLA